MLFMAAFEEVVEEEGPEEEVGESGEENEEHVLIPGVLFVNRREHRKLVVVCSCSGRLEGAIFFH